MKIHTYFKPSQIILFKIDLFQTNIAVLIYRILLNFSIILIATTGPFV